MLYLERRLHPALVPFIKCFALRHRLSETKTQRRTPPSTTPSPATSASAPAVSPTSSANRSASPQTLLPHPKRRGMQHDADECRSILPTTQTEPEELTKVRPDLPANLCAVVHKMMCKRPEGRYQTGRELLKDLNLVRDSLSMPRDSAAPTIAVAVGAPASEAGRHQGWAGARLSRVFIASAVIATIAGAAVG